MQITVYVAESTVEMESFIAELLTATKDYSATQMLFIVAVMVLLVILRCIKKNLKKNTRNKKMQSARNVSEA